MTIARKYAVKFEQWGIDEAFLDVTGKVGDWVEAETLARQIKQEIKDKECLTASIGVGPNKLIAKVASDFRKPDGLTVVKEEDAQKFLDPLPVRRLLWVGRKTEVKLKALGVNTIGDLARYDPSTLSSMFGVMGLQMHVMAKGFDRSEVEERVGVKSVSHETTFEEDISDAALVLGVLDDLCVGVQKEVADQNLLFRTVTVKVRYQGFETHTKSKTLAFLTNRLADLQKASKGLVLPYLLPSRKVRLVGVRVSNLASFDKQMTLF